MLPLQEPPRLFLMTSVWRQGSLTGVSIEVFPDSGGNIEQLVTEPSEIMLPEQKDHMENDWFVVAKCSCRHSVYAAFDLARRSELGITSHPS